MVRAYAAHEAGGKLEPFEFDAGTLRPDQVEIDVDYCGICHSDLSMLRNDFQMTSYPFVPGHEVAGKVAAVGTNVKHLSVGQTVGLGWFSESCMTCPQCMSGNHNLCVGAEQTVVGRFGGFADKVRCHAAWAIPLPEGIDPAKAGPLFCGGITVFNPIVQFDVKPTDRVGVIGIGGLGHLAIQFLSRWGCDVVAFTSNESKADEVRGMGARRVVSSRSDDVLDKLAGTLDFLLCTANVPLNWDAYLAALAPKGRLHVVGAVPEPIPVNVFSILIGQKSISATPLGSPETTAKMLEFCDRHDIAPIIEEFPMSKVNEAMEHLEAGKARYRIVLKNDF
ncbi:MAG: NAD(P)-dependent alcohol dehydrogenase [Candidatus Latescibacterota bacterium]|nr:MAG: NAD(P)-dependent alcohol dehydrogenase [Candidatus Latescibacterota bacterium]